jgi:hypothetical protein
MWGIQSRRRKFIAVPVIADGKHRDTSTPAGAASIRTRTRRYFAISAMQAMTFALCATSFNFCTFMRK